MECSIMTLARFELSDLSDVNVTREDRNNMADVDWRVWKITSVKFEK